MVRAVARQNVQSLQELIAYARITAPAHRSIPPVTLRNNWRPYHETGENPRIVTIVHNRPPIDSPILRSTNRGMRIAYMIRNADLTARNDKEC